MTKILIIRSDNIGDCVLFSGALKWIRRHWPNARIDLMVQPHIMNLFEYCPHVDRVLSINRFYPWCPVRRFFVKGTWMMERWLKKESIRRLWYPHYDIVIYPACAPQEETLETVRAIPATEKYGVGGCNLNLEKIEDTENAPERVFTTCHNEAKHDEWSHEIPRLARFLKTCGIDSDGIMPEFRLSADDEAYAKMVMPEGSVLGIFPGGTEKWRCWSVEKWVEFLGAQDVARRIAVFGGSDTVDVANDIIRLCGRKDLTFLNLVNRCTLRELAACIKRCVAMVSNESAGLHIATALGIPTVGIMGGHHYGRFYPWGNPEINRVAKVEMDCYHCNKHCRFGDYRCVKEIPVESVVREISEAVKKKRKVIGC